MFFNYYIMAMITITTFGNIDGGEQFFTTIRSSLARQDFRYARYGFSARILIFILAARIDRFEHCTSRHGAAADGRTFFCHDANHIRNIFGTYFFLFRFGFNDDACFSGYGTTYRFHCTFLRFFAIMIEDYFFGLLASLDGATLSYDFFARTVSSDNNIFISRGAFDLARIFRNYFFRLRASLFESCNATDRNYSVLRRDFAAVTRTQDFGHDGFRSTARNIGGRDYRHFTFGVFDSSRRQFTYFNGDFRGQRRFTSIESFLIDRRSRQTFRFCYTDFQLISRMEERMTAIRLRAFGRIRFILRANAIFGNSGTFFASFIRHFDSRFACNFIKIDKSNAGLDGHFEIETQCKRHFRFFGYDNGNFISAAFRIRQIRTHDGDFRALDSSDLDRCDYDNNAITYDIIHFENGFFRRLHARVFRLIFRFSFADGKGAVFNSNQYAREFVRGCIATFQARNGFRYVYRCICTTRRFRADIIARFCIFDYRCLCSLGSCIRYHTEVALRRLPRYHFQA